MTQAADSSSNHDTGRTNEEPELTQEDSVPVDGRDVEGEKLMKEVSNDKLKEKPGEEKQG